jgi:hypothetical protein
MIVNFPQVTSKLLNYHPAHTPAGFDLSTYNLSPQADTGRSRRQSNINLLAIAYL